MQREVRRVYKLLFEDDDFGGWQVGNGYFEIFICILIFNYFFLRKTNGSTENRNILNKLVKEVKSVNKDFETDDIKGKENNSTYIS